MAISEIWELSINGGAVATLSSLNVQSCSVQFVYPGASSCSLSVAVDDYGGDGILEDGDTVELIRRDVVYFVGKVVQTPRTGSGGDGGEFHTFVIRDAWHDLDRLPFVQTWNSWNGTEVVETEHCRVVLGHDGTAYVDTKTILLSLLTYAGTKGVSIAAGSFPAGFYIPAITTHSRTVGDLLRDVMRFHADCVAWIDYAAVTPVLHLSKRSTAAAVEFSASDQPVADVDISTLPELVPSNVIISYEGQILDSDDNRKLQIYRDAEPDETIGVGTIFATMPVDIETTGPTMKWHNVPVGVRTLPRTGAIGAEVEEWWIDHIEALHNSGVTTNDVDVATIDANPDIYQHKIEIIKDRANPVAPKTTDPGRNPIWSPEEITLDDLPNELVNGQLSDWMNVKAEWVTARATIAVRKTWVDGLANVQVRDDLIEASERIGDVSGHDAYFYQGKVRVRATDATTQTYRKATGYDPGTTLDVATQIVPGLAQSIYDSRSELHYSGAWTVTNREAGAERYMGKVINLLHDDRAEWATMRGLIQAESVDVETGQTTIQFGAPESFSIQDFREMLTAARKAQNWIVERRTGAVDALDATFSEGGETEENGVNFGSYGAEMRGGLRERRNTPSARPFEVIKLSDTEVKITQGYFHYMGDWTSPTWDASGDWEATKALTGTTWIRAKYSVLVDGFIVAGNAIEIGWDMTADNEGLPSQNYEIDFMGEIITESHSDGEILIPIAQVVFTGGVISSIVQRVDYNPMLPWNGDVITTITGGGSS